MNELKKKACLLLICLLSCMAGISLIVFVSDVESYHRLRAEGDHWCWYGGWLKEPYTNLRVCFSDSVERLGFVDGQQVIVREVDYGDMGFWTILRKAESYD